MIAVVQRVVRASVTVDGTSVGTIGKGILALVAVERGDSDASVERMAVRLAGIRLFPAGEDSGAAEKPFDLDVRQAGGQALVVSNFTVAASCEKGRRPSLDAAAAPDVALPLFDRLCDRLRVEGVDVQTGRFGANMQVELVNNGPVTFLLSSR
jgi:D-tyrosyl-tRNA(Tyr) deacylase